MTANIFHWDFHAARAQWWRNQMSRVVPVCRPGMLFKMNILVFQMLTIEV